MPTITFKDATLYFAPNGILPQKLRTAALKGLYSTALKAKQDIVAVEIPAVDPSPVNKGVYKAGWQVEKLPNEGAAFYNSVPYAKYIEWGVQPMNVVTSLKAIQAIAEWARKKLGGLDEKQALSVAHAIMTNMKKHGIFKQGKGLLIMTSYVDNKLSGVILREVEAEMKKVQF